METAFIASPQTEVEIQPSIVHFRKDGLLILLLHEEQQNDIGFCISEIVASGRKTVSGDYDFVGIIEQSGLSTYLLCQYCDFMGMEELTVIDGVILEGSIYSTDLNIDGQSGGHRLGIDVPALADMYRSYWYWEREYRIESGQVTREELNRQAERYRKELGLGRRKEENRRSFGQKVRRFFGGK